MKSHCQDDDHHMNHTITDRSQIHHSPPIPLPLSSPSSFVQPRLYGLTFSLRSTMDIAAASIPSNRGSPSILHFASSLFLFSARPCHFQWLSSSNSSFFLTQSYNSFSVSSLRHKLHPFHQQPYKSSTSSYRLVHPPLHGSSSIKASSSTSSYSASFSKSISYTHSESLAAKPITHAYENIPVQVSPEDHNVKPMKSFHDLAHSLHPILQKNILERAGYVDPTPVQSYCLPILIHAQRDVMTCAQTGSGKTAMFLIPALHNLMVMMDQLRNHHSPRARPGNNPNNNHDSISSSSSLFSDSPDDALTHPDWQPRHPENPSLLARPLRGPHPPKFTVAPAALVVAPTRELALQIYEAAQILGAHADLKMSCLYGGAEPRLQLQSIERGCDLVIATPGRLQDFIQRGNVVLKKVRFLVVDEADRMLDMGFEPQLRYIVSKLSRSDSRRNVMCSATFPQEIQRMASEFLNDYYFVTVGRVGSTTQLIKQKPVYVSEDQKEAMLLKLLDEDRKSKSLIFVNTKTQAQALTDSLYRNNYHVLAIHGDLSQNARESALEKFKRKPAAVLVATDVAARGLDVPDVERVIQFDTATDIDNYVHRIGRTGRAGNQGTAISFFTEKHRKIAGSVLQMLRECGQKAPIWLQGMYHSVLMSQDPSEDVDATQGTPPTKDGEFGGQDFRQGEKPGSWGAHKNVVFDDFDYKAYGHFDARNPYRSKDERQELFYPDDDDDNGAASTFSEINVDRFFKKPSATSKALQKQLDLAGLHLSSKPDQEFMKNLRFNDPKVYYEYLANFPPSLLRDSQTKNTGFMDTLPKLLIVTEKPSIAQTVAEVIANGKYIRRKRGASKAIPVYETVAYFPPAKRKYLLRITSVVGHVLCLGFAEAQRGPPHFLFRQNIVKQIETSSSKLKVIEHLRGEAKDCDYLSLWLDCDREGENIAHEVIAVTREMFRNNDQIYRARFSAITPKEILHAYENQQKPNPNDSLAVDARQELDLKVGVAFSRLLTRKYANLARERFDRELKMMTYGPCQSPTLYFCVERFWEIQQFKREKFWTISCSGFAPKLRRNLQLSWKNGKTFDRNEAMQIRNTFSSRCRGIVESVQIEEKVMRRPVGLNTVNLLMACSAFLGISPKKTMTLAEDLYTSGYISYPRTETSQYPPSFDIIEILEEHKNHDLWGRDAMAILKSNPKVPKGGKNVGDHPPISPTKMARKSDFGKDILEWRIYEFVTRHFLGSLMGDLHYRECISEVVVDSGREKITMVHKENMIDSLGYAKVMNWVLRDLIGDEDLRSQSEKTPLVEGTEIDIQSFQAVESSTEPPKFLQEHELVHKMDKFGIGTDASMATHISNIQDRKYVVVVDNEGQLIRNFNPKQAPKGQKRQQGRYLVPTTLGLSLIEGFRRIEEDLVLPKIRAFMEEEVSQIAKGQLNKDQVMKKNIQWFAEKFRSFEGGLDIMDEIVSKSLNTVQDHLRYMRRNQYFQGPVEDPQHLGSSPRARGSGRYSESFNARNDNRNSRRGGSTRGGLGSGHR